VIQVSVRQKRHSVEQIAGRKQPVGNG